MPFITAFEDTTAIQWGVVIGASLAAAIWDLRTRRIPNALTGPLLAAGLFYAVCFDGARGLGEAAGACLLLAAPFVLMFLFAGGGAGDAKFMGAIGAWLGLSHGSIVLASVCIAGIVLAVVKAVASKRLKFVLVSTYFSIYTLLFSLAGHQGKGNVACETCVDDRERGITIPYGVAIFAGVCGGGVFVLLCQS
ncbi:MAG: A24 family peptidase [Planctomycetota bacterium]